MVVPALGGAPGVRSARYAGPDATDADRIGKLLREMEGRKGERAARAIRLRDGNCGRGGAHSPSFPISAEGTIAEEPRGSNGFGYDPIFQTLDTNRTYGELAAEEKEQITATAAGHSADWWRFFRAR